MAPVFAMAFDTSAQYAVLLDYSTGKVIYSKNSATQMTPSSMSKLMTLYVAFSELKSNRIKLDDLVTVSEKAWRAEGSKMFIEVRSKVSVSDLLRGIIIQSGNDASIALAEYIAGDEASFVERMNKEAKKLGLEGSNFANATGLPDPKHYMTAYDLAILSALIIREFPDYYPLFSEKEFTFNNITQPNRNYEIGEGGIDGLKTGHTSIAGYGIVASSIKDGRRLIAVVNGLESEQKRLEEAKKVLAYGYGNFYNLKLASANALVGSTAVWQGKDSRVNFIASHDLELVLPTSITSDEVQIFLKTPNLVNAPIRKGEHIADFIVKIPGEIPVEVPLVAEKNVKQATFIGQLYGNFMARLRGVGDQ
ncbi:MAG: serine-type D-Ala-D-Ala carboxypeptidase [Candidatus Midichloriaceae bacterium]|nr:serine-type D-Ala-D-Ala carboxypeptidase [Candidatus Midichloriaceae bacterium]